MHLEGHHFSKIHKFILGIISGDLEDELNSPMPNADEIDSAGNTALIWAVRRGDHAAIGRLVDWKADVNVCNKLGYSALSYVSRLSDSKCLKLLLNGGAKTTQTNIRKGNSLHLAVNSNERETIKTLVAAGIDIDARNAWGTTSLFIAAGGCLNSAEALLECGANMNIVADAGDSPLFKSIHFHADDVTRLLLEHRVTYNQIDKFGNSIYHNITALAGGLDTIKILSSAHLSNIINTKAPNKAGKTATQIAYERTTQEDNFAEKSEELLAEFQSRDISSGANTGIDTDFADNRILSAILERICQARVTATSSNLFRG